MGQKWRLAAVTACLAVAAGCGLNIGVSGGTNTAATGARTATTGTTGTTVTKATGSMAAARPAALRAWEIKGISGDGRIADHFSIWEYQTIRLEAVVEGADGPLTYKWDTYGHIWGKKDQPVIRFSGPWEGWYDVTCTVTDAAGNSRKKSVSVRVWRVTTPPPMPPIPPVPHP